jgi:hypothetical protein
MACRINSVIGAGALAFAAAGLPFMAQAATVVFEKVDVVSEPTAFAESFEITRPGPYQATLTDFEFPTAFDEIGLTVTSSTQKLGSLSAPGSFTFDAEPGTYYVGFLAIPEFQYTVPQFFGLLQAALNSASDVHPKSAVTDANFGVGMYGIEVKFVPIPAAAWLLGSGLFGLLMIARGRRASAGEPPSPV